jgi:hypothetical protein
VRDPQTSAAAVAAWKQLASLAALEMHRHTEVQSLQGFVKHKALLRWKLTNDQLSVVHELTILNNTASSSSRLAAARATFHSSDESGITTMPRPLFKPSNIALAARSDELHVTRIMKLELELLFFALVTDT